MYVFIYTPYTYVSEIHTYIHTYIHPHCVHKCEMVGKVM